MAKRLIDADVLKKNFASIEDLRTLSTKTIGEVIKKTPTVKAIEIPESGIGDVSDGYHTFNELYHHRAVLFSVICNMMPDKAWKSKLHDTGDMYDGMFIVGIDTPQGQATYHYDINPYWNMFKVKELEKAPEWDGHTPVQAIERIGALADYLIAHGVTVNEWRPASDPPKENGCYLTFRKGIGKQVCRYANDLFKVHSVDFAYYDKGGIAGWYTNEGNGYYEIDDVTHWMPLPRLRRR